MLPNDMQAVWAILLAIVPGFLATSVWARAKTWRGPSGELRVVLMSLALSAIVQLALAPLTISWLLPVRRDLEAFPERVVIWTTLAVLALPVAGGVFVGRLSDWIFNARSAVITGRIGAWLGRIWPAAPPPSIWDWVFTANPPYGQFLIIEFQDGTKVAGVFAEGSLALTSPEPHGLFLISEWQMDDLGNIVSELPGTAGVTILDTSSIRSIRILEPGEEDGEDSSENR